MKSFNIYKSPKAGYLAIQQGFSWHAFLIPFIWLFYKKEYLRGFAVTLLVVSLVLFSRENLIAVIIVYISFSLLIGILANGWLEFNLIGRGIDYKIAGTIEANTSNEAVSN